MASPRFILTPSILPHSSSKSTQSSILSPLLDNVFLSLYVPISTMKFAKIIPTKLFKTHKKSRSVSRSEADPSSFGSHTTSSSSSSDDISFKKPDGLSTPTSVLPSSGIRSNDWFGSSTPDVYIELKQAFEMIDRDGEGKVKKEQLETLLGRLLGAEPPSDDELKMMLSEVDRDGDGCISLEEFHAIGSAFAKPACDSELREAFAFFDSDGDGKITAEELHHVFEIIGDRRCTLEDCRRMIGDVSRNGDGVVCFEDFMSLMMLRGI